VKPKFVAHDIRMMLGGGSFQRFERIERLERIEPERSDLTGAQRQLVAMRRGFMLGAIEYRSSAEH
jgi:hypothetical protein